MAVVRINSDSGRDKNKNALTPVVSSGQVSSKKKNIGEKFADAFISDAAKDVKEYVLMDVIIPGIKDTLLNVLEMVLFGGSTYRSRSRRSRNSYENTSYRAFYQSEYDDDYDYSYGSTRRRRSARERRSNRIDYREIVVHDRNAAIEIMNTLRDQIEKYGAATKADLYELIDQPSTHVDYNFGWTNPNDIGIAHVTNGYLIDVADAKELD